MNKIVKLIAKPFNLCISSVSPSCFGKWTNISFVLTLTTFWLVGIPAEAKSITTVSSQSNMVAVADTSMVAYIEKKSGFQIPAEYRNKIDSIFKDNFPHIKVDIDGISSWEFTVDLVLKEMKSDWSISKDNQFLFIFDAICKVLTGEYAIKKDSDGLKDYRTAISKIRSCRDRYKEGIMPFIDKQKAEYRRQIAENEQQIAENERQIAENKQQIAENTRQIMQLDTIWVKKNMIEFYDLYKENPKIILKTELAFMMKRTKEVVINECKKYNIDYKAILRRELGDDKKVKDLLKFYGIEE